MAGNACVIFGFGVTWGGVRVFYGERPRWDVTVVVTAAAGLGMVLCVGNRASLNMATIS